MKNLDDNCVHIKRIKITFQMIDARLLMIDNRGQMIFVKQKMLEEL